MRAMETTSAASLDTGKEQGNRSSDASSEGQFGDSLGPDGVMLQRWKEKALVGRHVSLLLGMGDERAEEW